MVNVNKLREILMTHPVANLRKAIAESNRKLGPIKGYWAKGTTKQGLVEGMLTEAERFKDIKPYVRPARQPRAKKQAPAPAPAPAPKKRLRIRRKKQTPAPAPAPAQAPAKKPRKPRADKGKPRKKKE